MDAFAVDASGLAQRARIVLLTRGRGPGAGHRGPWVSKPSVIGWREVRDLRRGADGAVHAAGGGGQVRRGSVDGGAHRADGEATCAGRLATLVPGRRAGIAGKARSRRVCAGGGGDRPTVGHGCRTGVALHLHEGKGVGLRGRPGPRECTLILSWPTRARGAATAAGWSTRRAALVLGLGLDRIRRWSTGAPPGSWTTGGRAARCSAFCRLTGGDHRAGQGPGRD